MLVLKKRNLYDYRDSCGAHIGYFEFGPKTIKFETSKCVNFYDIWCASLNLAKTYNKTIRVFYGDIRLNIANLELCNKVNDVIKCAVNAANKTRTTIGLEINDIWVNVYPESTFQKVKKNYVGLLNRQFDRTKRV